MGENDFELSIPHFLGFHRVFNVELLRPYFPPLLDTSDATENLHPIELNTSCIEWEIVDQIMDTNTKYTRQQTIKLYRVIKARLFLHQGKWLTKSQVQQNFPHMMEELAAMDSIAYKGGGIIYVDIGGHPLIPLAQSPISILAVCL
jgi:hypothetical protein